MTPRYLVVGPSWVGDMVMAQSLFIRLRELHPQAQIDVLAPAWSVALLERMPQVRRGIVMPLGHGQLGVAQRYRLGRSLRAEGYSQALVLPNSFKSALVPFWAGIPERIGYRGELRWGLLTQARRLDKQALPKTVQRFVALAEPAGAVEPNFPRPKLVVAAEAVSAAAARHGLSLTGAPVLALCPGAEYGPAKRWPAAHFAALARQALTAGWQAWLFGSAKDKAISDEISAAAPGVQDLTGRTSLAEAIDLLAQARVVVSNDSGLMHVAAALERPLVALYGSSDPLFTPPLAEQARLMSLGLACSPCFKRECPLGHLKCLVDLRPEPVWQAVRELGA